MIRKAAAIAIFTAVCGPLMAQDLKSLSWDQESVSENDQSAQMPAPNADQVKACLSSVLARPVEVAAEDDGYSLFLPGVGRGFARDIICENGKAVLSDAVMVNDVIRTDQVAGSAMKADRVVVWTPTARAACSTPIDYGIEMTNFRWFNWDERLTDGGNKRLEIVRNADGREVRISTISHLRAAEVIWSPKPEEAASQCAPSGGYQVSDLDIRWSTRGTAYRLLSEGLMGKISVPLVPSDAKSARAPYGMAGVLTGVSIQDITETSISRAGKMEFSFEAAPESAVPWSFLISKYSKELIFRRDDDSLLRRVLPLDLSNTLHFTKGFFKLSVPETSAQTAAILPFSSSVDLSSVNLSSTIISGEALLSFRGAEDGDLRVNADMFGVGAVNGVFAFSTQLFGKNVIEAAASGGVDLHGKTSPALTGLSLRFRDKGFKSAFLSLMKSSPSSFLVRVANKDMEFWRDVSLWLRKVEEGEEPALIINFASPQVMMNGFWGSAFKGAKATIEE